jgi:hypothetical protein
MLTRRKKIKIEPSDSLRKKRECITKVREELELETLEERRLSLRLILICKEVEGLVPLSLSHFKNQSDT